jgi:simple sugar transport system permease protein
MIGIVSSLGAAAVRIATIYILAATGSNFAEKSGILNMTIEGNMLTAAFAAVTASYLTGSPVAGLFAAVLAGVVFSAFYGFTVITAKADQMISSLAFNLFAAGITPYLLSVVFHSVGSTPRVASFSAVAIPLLHKVPVLGTVLFNQPMLVYLCVVLVTASHYVLYYTRFGLRVIACGEHPAAASTVGIRVRQIRYCSMLIAGAMAGLAGAYLSISFSSQFVKNLTAGRGYIALSTVILGRHKPFNIALAGLLFGLCDALQIRLQQTPVPTQFVQMLPYIVTVVVITFFIGKDDSPAAIGMPY